MRCLLPSLRVIERIFQFSFPSQLPFFGGFVLVSLRSLGTLDCWLHLREGHKDPSYEALSTQGAVFGQAAFLLLGSSLEMRSDSEVLGAPRVNFSRRFLRALVRRLVCPAPVHCRAEGLRLQPTLGAAGRPGLRLGHQ